MKRLRLGAALHFLIAIGHIGCLFALDEAFEAYGIREIMHQMVSGHVWMLYGLTIGLVLAFTLAGLYALSATGDIRRLPLTRTAIITIVEQVLDLVQREAEPLQVADVLQLLHLVDTVVAVASPLVHLVRREQPFLFVVTQGLYRHLHQL